MLQWVSDIYDFYFVISDGYGLVWWLFLRMFINISDLWPLFWCVNPHHVVPGTDDELLLLVVSGSALLKVVLRRHTVSASLFRKHTHTHLYFYIYIYLCSNCSHLQVMDLSVLLRQLVLQSLNLNVRILGGRRLIGVQGFDHLQVRECNCIDMSGDETWGSGPTNVPQTNGGTDEFTGVSDEEWEQEAHRLTG